jgi:predicted nucleotidyltransferase
MSWRSDIDLAVWGLPEKDYFKAVGVLLDIAEDFSLDLIEAQHARSYILPAISQGIEL